MEAQIQHEEVNVEVLQRSHHELRRYGTPAVVPGMLPVS